MDIQAEKLRLIEWIAGLNDVQILTKFIDLKTKQEADWWDEISVEEKNEILEGLAQADSGDLTSHEEVMKKYTKWL